MTLYLQTLPLQYGCASIWWENVEKCVIGALCVKLFLILDENCSLNVDGKSRKHVIVSNRLALMIMIENSISYSWYSDIKKYDSEKQTKSLLSVVYLWKWNQLIQQCEPTCVVVFDSL